jgi:hypothetical protein
LKSLERREKVNGHLIDDPMEAEDDYFPGEDIYDEPEAVTRDQRARAAGMRARLNQLRASGRGSLQPPRARPQSRYIPPQPQPSGRPADTRLVSQGFTAVSEDMNRTKAAIQHVDLERKVQEDMVAHKLATHAKQIYRHDIGLGISSLVSVFENQFPDVVKDSKFLNFLPLLSVAALAPAKKGSGAGAFFSDVRVLAVAGAVALALVSHFRDRDQRLNEVILSGPSTLATNGKFTFRARAHDGKNKTLNNRSYTWYSSDNRIASVVATTGEVTANAPGIAEITARDIETNVEGVAIVTVT